MPVLLAAMQSGSDTIMMACGALSASILDPEQTRTCHLTAWLHSTVWQVSVVQRFMHEER